MYLLGAEDGIYVSKKGGFEKLMEFEMVTQMDLIANPPLFIAVGGTGPLSLFLRPRRDDFQNSFLTGKTKHVRVWPLNFLEGGAGWPITLEVTQGCSFYSLGKIESDVVLAVAVKKRVLLFRVDSTKRFKKIKVCSTATDFLFPLLLLFKCAFPFSSSRN